MLPEEKIMKIPTAKQAREKVSQGQYDKATEQAARIERAVNEAIEKGSQEVTIQGKIEAANKLALENEGYVVTIFDDSSYRNESSYTISW